MGSTPVRHEVLAVITKRPGEIIYLKDIVAATGLDEKQVQSAINNMRRDDPTLESTIQTVARGQAWRYDPTGRRRKDGEKRMFEELAVTKTGALIIQDQDGNLYRAEELQ